TRDVEHTLTHEDPHRARDDGLGRREDDVARRGRGITERHRYRKPAVARERELARRNVALVDLALRAGDHLGDRAGVDAELGRIVGDLAGERRVGHGPRLTAVIIVRTRSLTHSPGFRSLTPAARKAEPMRLIRILV